MCSERRKGSGSLIEQSQDFAANAVRRAWSRVKPLGPLLREPRIAALRYEGSLAGEPGEEIAMLYVGDAQRAHEFELFLGADASRDIAPPRELFRGRITSYLTHRRRIDELAAAADLVLREVFPVEPYPEEGLVYHPFVDGYLDVAEGLTQQIRRVRSRSYRRLLREIQRRGDYSSEIARDPEALERFWRDLHEPYVRARFGKRANLDGLAALAGPYEARGRLLIVRHSSEIVAAALVLHDFVGKGILSYFRNGIRDFDSISPNLLSERTAALELSLMRYATEHRFQKIDLGFTRAIASDGRFIHKRRLGCRFSPLVGGPRLVLRCSPSLSPAFFARFAILAGAPGSFSLHLGFDGTSPPRRTQQWRAVLKSYMAPGLSEVRLHVASSARGAARDSFERALRDAAGEREVVIDEV
jgi:GNAT acetyltransferase-like protein